MLNVTKELTALARKLGYTGKAPDTVAKAIDAITASVGEGSGSGGGGGVFNIEVDSETHNFNKTYKEIKDAYDSGKNCIIELSGTLSDSPYTAYASIFTIIELTSNDELVYLVGFTDTIHGSFSTAFTDSENGYPHISEE